ncbi:hypothetical protein [Sphingomonas sp. DT-204]|uniref:hypothetical protein n=1 Tax=Sphingomonas sp. DT-204 TaxID=3396166 RepID=UPI003F1BEF91
MERERIARLLPESYQSAIRRDNPLAAVLAAMEALHAPAEARLDALDAEIDPLRAEEPFVFMLADWLGLAGYLDWSGGRPGAGVPSFAAGTGRLRLLVAEAAQLARSRGSRRTLERFLAVAIGLSGIMIEDAIPDAAGRPRSFHLRVNLPAEARRYADLVARIVDAERPAYATYEIAYQPQPA